MNKKQQTIETYDKSAQALADKFDGQGARVADIEAVFKLVGKADPMVFEIGCGNGRDAKEICARTSNYFGMDISEKLVELARKKVPGRTFLVGDIEDFLIPYGIDAIFAFASLVHVPKDSLERIIRRSYQALNLGGVFHLSMKSAPKYVESTEQDEFGVRTYYLYSEDDMKSLVGEFLVERMQRIALRGQIWLEVILRK